MKFTIAATIISLTSLVAATSIPRQSCAQATRFGVMTVSPSNTAFNAGDDITVSVDFNCGIGQFGIVPKYLDYTIEVPVESNNGHEPPIVLARRELQAGSRSDTFTTKIPHAFFFSGAAYTVVFTNTYATAGTDGSEVLVQGGVSQGITINA